MSPTARRFVAVAVAALGVASLVGVAWLWWADAALGRPYAGWDGDSVTIDLERGLTADAMVARLADVGVLANRRLTSLWLRWSGDAGALHAGEYHFDVPISAREVVGRLRAGAVWLHPLTVPEGLSAAEVAARISETGFGDVEAALAAVRDPAVIRDRDPQASDLEGYLFPDTYRFARGTPAADIVRAMIGRFETVTGEPFRDRARAAGMTVREAVTLASMIEEETSVPGERSRISRVFHNRLARGMKLQCDPTVLYALRREGIEVGRLSRKDLQFDSPYNTYRVQGLPPGPICSPGAASLDAAVAPGPGDELYFVAKPGGGHTFTKTLDAHRRAVREWRAYARSSR